MHWLCMLIGVLWGAFMGVFAMGLVNANNIKERELEDMNNETRLNINIKLRNDNVFDIYVNKKLFTSKGSLDSTLEEIKKIVNE